MNTILEVDWFAPTGSTAVLTFCFVLVFAGWRNVCRWLLVPPAVVAHLALGSVYAWSILNNSLTREIGVVGSTGTSNQQVCMRVCLCECECVSVCVSVYV